MTRAHYFVLSLAFTLCTSFVSAQVPTGTPRFGSFGGGPDIINLANLNTYLVIPVLHKPGRGTNFTYDLGYDSSVWLPMAGSWNPVSNWSWRGMTEPATGYVTAKTHSTSCPNPDGGPPLTIPGFYTDTYVYHDTFGSSHPFDVTVQSADCGGGGEGGLATDGSGFSIAFDISGDGTFAITSASGSVIVTPPTNSRVGAGTFTDRNGNRISVNSSGVFTDTLGATALTVAGSGTPASPTTFTYTAPSGGSASYTMKYTAYTVKTNFGCSGIAEYGPTSNNLVSEIDLPDNSKYTFTYESTPGFSGDVTGRLASVTLPTGGTISYTYSGGTNGINCADGSAATVTRTTPDGTWTYAQVKGSGAAATTTVTDPQGNQTVIYFEGIYETQRYVYQGSSSSGTLLWVNTTCYNGNRSNCRTTPITLPITEISTNPQFGGTEIQCFHYFFYDSFGNLTREDDYDYGNYPQLGPLLRKTLITYAALGNNINAFRQTITVQDGAGRVLAQTTNTYDEGTPAATSGTPQHVAVFGSRGNLTTSTQLVQGSTSLTSHFTYYDTGTPKTSTDVNGAVTTTNYSSASCGNSFPTSVSEPLSMSRSFAWNCTGGVMTSVTDENNQVTSTTYNDPSFWRPASINYPDGGQTSWTYNSSTSITTTTKMNSSQNIVSTTLLDGLGRTRRAQLGDPQGTDYTDTTYDSLGRLASVSNPYRSTSDATYGITSYVYDALSRVCVFVPPDGTAVSGNTCPASQPANDIFASYSTNSTTITTTVTDQAGKKRTSAIDSLGRLTQITEDPGGLGYITSYTYDAIGNLTGVTENSSRQRTYAYDGVSRLTSETNPESGTVTYGYDASGHAGDLTSRTATAPNQTGSATVVTTYTYDALHRLTQKSYSDGTTPTASYHYDETAPWSWSLSNPIGRLTTEYTSNSSGTLTANLRSYDPVGRIWVLEQAQPSNLSANSQAVEPTYDLAGDITSKRAVQSGVFDFTISYAYDTAARPISVTSNYVDSQHPATLVSGLSYMPASAYTAMTLGNGILESRSYNKRLQPTEIKSYTSSNFVRYDFTYGYNDSSSHNNGNLMTWNSTGWDFNFNRSYSYDALNRLSALSDSNSGQSCKGLSWSYDAWGNRTDQNVTSGTCNAFHQSVDSNNRLNSSPYQYDAAGNMTHDASHSYSYDAESRLVSVDGGSTASYLYDAEGHRVQKTVSGAWTDFLPDLNGNVVAETTVPGWQVGYVYLGGQLLAEYKNTTTYFAQQDHLGSTRLLTQVNGNGQFSWDYYPFGELNSTDSSVTSHKFTEDERDSESNLDHTLFRQYSSSLGRWMHPDPAGLAAVDPANPQSWNRYSYVGNNPCSRIDPLGLDQCNLGVLARNTAGLNQNQITQIQNQIQSIFGQTTDGHGNTVGVAFNPSGRADATLTFENSAWYKIGSWGGSLGSTLCWPSLGCSGSSVYVDRVQQSYPGSAFALGTVAAHELFHQTTNTGHLDDPTNLMSANPTTPVPGTNLTQAQVAQLFKECRKLHPATSRGGGGGAGGGRSQLLDSGASCNTVDLPGYLGGSGSLCSDSSWCGIMGCGTGEGGGSASIDEIIF